MNVCTYKPVPSRSRNLRKSIWVWRLGLMGTDWPRCQLRELEFALFLSHWCLPSTWWELSPTSAPASTRIWVFAGSGFSLFSPISLPSGTFSLLFAYKNSFLGPVPHVLNQHPWCGWSVCQYLGKYWPVAKDCLRELLIPLRMTENQNPCKEQISHQIKSNSKREKAELISKNTQVCKTTSENGTKMWVGRRCN